MKNTLKGYEFILDTGECKDHGLFLPKQQPDSKAVGNHGATSRTVSLDDLDKVGERGDAIYRAQMKRAGF